MVQNFGRVGSSMGMVSLLQLQNMEFEQCQLFSLPMTQKLLAAPCCNASCGTQTSIFIKEVTTDMPVLTQFK